MRREVGSSSVLAGLGLVAALLLAVPGAVLRSQEAGGRARGVDVDLRDAPLAPGDAIRITIIGKPELSGIYPVDETGTVALPVLGGRVVTQMPAAELKHELMEEYDRQFLDQAAQVTLLRRIRVLGAVRTPGLYHVDFTMSLADLVALAGGTTPNGKLEGVQIVRGNQKIRSNLESEALLFGQLQSGDQIVVPERGWLARNPGIVVGATISAVGFILSRALF